jgi:hypothetical protein
VYLRVPIYVAETEASARDDPEPSIMQFYRTLGLQLEGTAKRAGVCAGEQRAERGLTLQTISYEDALRNKVIVGTPALVVMRLQDLTAKLGLNGSWRSSIAGVSSTMKKLCARCSSCATRSRRVSAKEADCDLANPS